jgi:Ribosomal protein L11 methyltransferase (PrmA)
VILLINSGVLRSVDDAAEIVHVTESGGFGGAPIHIRMLNDQSRTAQYLKAIRRTVNPGDVVVDVGTGTGVLGVAAAKAGARHVYAIEATGIRRLAEKVFQANDVSELVTVVPGWSTQVELPERANVIVSEIIGANPFDERVLEAIIDARKRFGCTGVRMLPSKMTVFATGVTIPNSTVQELVFTESTSLKWNRLYGINFGPLAQTPRDRTFMFNAATTEVKNWKALTPAVPIAQIDFSAINTTAILERRTCTAGAGGALNGVVLSFVLELTEGVTLEVTPEAADTTNHWASPVWLLPTPFRLEASQTFELEFSYNSPGTADGATARLIPKGN